MNKNIIELGKLISGGILFEIFLIGIPLFVVTYDSTNGFIAIIITLIYLGIPFYFLNKNRLVLGFLPVSLLWTQYTTGVFVKSPSFKSIAIGIFIFLISLSINSFLWKFGNRLENEGEHFNLN